MLSGAILLFVVIRSLIVEPYKIPSGSMEHTLLPGDFLLVNKLSFGARIPFTDRRLPALREPVHGDIVIFTYPVNPETRFVKRVVGVPGDTVSMRSGRLTRNGEPLEEPYVEHLEPLGDPMLDTFNWQRGFLSATATAALGPTDPYHPTRDNWGPIVVPSGHRFVLGDNRDLSLDSRYWGFVPDSLILGTPFMVYYSFVASDSSVTMPWLTRVRWSRLGHLIR